MATITITSEGTLGDHFPFLALGEALVGRGHVVRYAAPAHLAGAVAECGMEWRPCRPDLDPAKVRAKPEAFDHWSPQRGGPGRPPGADSEDLFEKYGFGKKLEDLCEATTGSDMLVCSRLAVTGRTASDLTGVPWITVSVVPWFHPDPETAAARGIKARAELDTTRPSMRMLVEKVNALRVQRGLDVLCEEREWEMFEAPRVLLATSPLFGKPVQQAGREIVQTGFWPHVPPKWRGVGLPDEASVWLALQKHPPLVLSFSSQPVANPERVLDCHLEAARRLGRGLVVQGGWADWGSRAFTDACESGDGLHLPAGPQDELFRRAGAVVHHGGIGTTARALAAAAPQLVEPYGNDQFYNARQVVSLGIGAAVNPHALSPEGLAKVLERCVLIPDVRETAESHARQLSQEPGVAAAVERIEFWTTKDRTG